MANYRRIASGNWSTLAEWEDDSGGSYAPSTQLPSGNDAVYANGFNTVLDQNIEVLNLLNTGGGTTNGGNFQIVSSLCDEVIVNNEARGFSINPILIIDGINHDINIFGDFTGAASKILIRNSTDFTLNFYGSISAGTTNNHYGIDTTTGVSNLTLNILGSVIGGVGSSSNALRLSNTSGEVNIVGIVTGSAINNPSSATIRNSSGSMLINIMGTASGLISNSITEMRIDGILNAGSVSTFNSTINTLKLKGLINYLNTATNPLKEPDNLFIDPSTTIAFRNWANDGDTFLYTGDISGGNPQESDVRKGVEYGVNDEFTGELEQVDITGLAEDLLNEIAISTLPLAERLRNVATVQSTGDQFNGFE